jgi:hypothetical protein
VSADAGDAKEATDAFQKTMAVAPGREADFAEVSRSAYKGDKGVLSLLRLDKRRPKSIDDFIIAAEQLYDTTRRTPPVTAKLEKRGISMRNGKSKVQIEGVKKSAATRKLNREKKASTISKAAKEQQSKLNREFTLINANRKGATGNATNQSPPHRVPRLAFIGGFNFGIQIMEPG